MTVLLHRYFMLSWLLLVGCVVSSSTWAEPLKRIAVMDFVDKTDYGKGRLGISASDMLVGELQRSEQFVVVAYSGMDEALKIQALGQSGAVDSSTAVEAGRLIGASAFINGSISEFGVKKGGLGVPGILATKKLTARAVVDIQLIDATSGSVLMSETAEGVAETKATKILNIGSDGSYDETLAGKALRAAITTLVQKVTVEMGEVPWQGFVLDVTEEAIWISGGKDMGLQPGQRLKTMTASKTVRAPNGRAYSIPGKEKGQLKIIQVLEDISQAALVAGDAPKKSDRILLLE